MQKITDKIKLFIGVFALCLLFSFSLRHALNDYGVSDPNNELHPQVLAQTNSGGDAECGCGGVSCGGSGCGHGDDGGGGSVSQRCALRSTPNITGPIVWNCCCQTMGPQNVTQWSTCQRPPFPWE